MTKEQKADLERQLQEAISRSGLGLNEIERRCGVSHVVLSRFLRGERSLTLSTASKLCQFLGLTLCADERSAEASAEEPRGRAGKAANQEQSKGGKDRPASKDRGKKGKGE